MSLGLTANGRLAAAKALHPACDVGAQRWPDKAANETVVLQNTDVYTINSNSGDSSKTWNCQMWLTNLVDCALVTSSSLSDVALPNPNKTMNKGSSGMGQQPGKSFAFWYSKQWNGGDDRKHPNSTYQTARITSRSVTVDLVSNATSNQGVVYAAQITPNMQIMPFSSSPELTFKAIQDKITKLVDSRIKKHVEDDDESGDDEEVDAVVARGDEDVVELGELLGRLSTGSYAPEGTETSSRCVFQDWPCGEQEIMQMSSGAYMAKADRGVYLVLKHSQDTLAYIPTAGECYLSAGVPHSNNEQTSMMNVLLSSGWNIGAILFKGLSGDSQLCVKVITTLEMTVRPDSEVSRFVEEAPALDLMAIQHTRAAMGNLPDAFPASDNVLGGIVEKIAEALERSGIPFVSRAAGWARKVNSATGGAATNFLDGIF